MIKKNNYKCPICLCENINKTLKLVKLKHCNHIFCKNCIDNWIIKDKKSCPICR